LGVPRRKKSLTFSIKTINSTLPYAVLIIGAALGIVAGQFIAFLLSAQKRRNAAAAEEKYRTSAGDQEFLVPLNTNVYGALDTSPWKRRNTSHGTVL
jgi:hypothetical protein